MEAQHVDHTIGAPVTAGTGKATGVLAALLVLFGTAAFLAVRWLLG